jgi:TolA-binding protein
MRSKSLLYAAAVLSGVLMVWWAAGLKSDVATLRSELARVKAEAETRVAPSPKDLRLARVERLRLERDNAAAKPISSESTAEQLQQARSRIAELEGLVSELSDAWTQFSEDQENQRAAALLQELSTQQVSGTPDNPPDGAR